VDFDAATATARQIGEEDIYPGVDAERGRLLGRYARHLVPAPGTPSGYRRRKMPVSVHAILRGKRSRETQPVRLIPWEEVEAEHEARLRRHAARPRQCVRRSRRGGAAASRAT
jgi:hypothetical protein